jgi:hypothetical protein
MEDSGIFKTMKRQWNIAIIGSRLDGMENRVGFQNNEKADHWIVTGWHGGQWDFQNNEKTMSMEHCDHWIVIGCHYPTIDMLNE